MWQDAENFLQKDKDIGLLITKWGHCKIKPIEKSEYFKDLVNAITSQQLSGKAAETIFLRVESLLGVITPEAILNKKDQELRDCGLSWGKVGYLKDLAKQVIEGNLNINELDSLSDEDVIKKLVFVKGIGRWTAEMFLMFSLARIDIFPVNDLGIKKGFEKVVGLKWDKIASPKYALEHWKPYRTVASWYLWRSLDNR